MAEFIVNPRRAPRAPARCRVAVASASGSFEAETEDVGAHGCQIVSPTPVRKGETVRIAIADAKLPEPLQVMGRVAWVSAQPPWRAGIAFDDAAIAECAAWFERLLEAHPGIRSRRQVPERIPSDALLYLGPPPRFVVDFSPDEAALLRAIGSGARLDELLVRFRSRGDLVARAIFSLFARSAVTLVRGQAAHPESWKRILDDVEASLALESLGSAPASLAAPPEASGPPPAVPSATPAPGAIPAPISPFGTPPHDPSPQLVLDDPRTSPAPAGKGAAWGKPARARSPEAQSMFERAHAEFLGGDVNGAIALLRRALQLAPGDPDIADVFGKLAFGRRDPGWR